MDGRTSFRPSRPAIWTPVFAVLIGAALAGCLGKSDADLDPVPDV